MNGDIGIGKLIDQERGRDAIHVAVAPVEAAEKLLPGEDVGINDEGKATKRNFRAVGIVDPFLKVNYVKPGERFYLFLYPGTITSLRHEWVHPAFKGKPDRATEDPRKKESREWVEDFARKLGISYERLMGGAEAYAQNGDYLHMGDNESYNDYYGEMPTFWSHYSALTGKAVTETGGFFSCAC